VLPNLITGEWAIPEFHQENCTAANLATAVDAAMREGPHRRSQLAEVARVPGMLAVPGGVSASEAAAAVVISYLGTRA